MAAEQSLLNLKEEYQDSLSIIAYHLGDEFQNEICENRYNLYQINRIPTAVFNGRYKVFLEEITNIDSVYNYYILNALSESTYYQILLNPLNNSTINLKIISNSENPTPQEYRLFVFLTEDSLFSEIAPFFENNWVLRENLFPLEGINFNATIFDTFDTTFNISLNQRNLNVVALIQNVNNLEIIQSKSLKLGGER
ncbi:MAG: hypothetical protein ABIK90_03165 [candidate division WOR-3 bacterium]